MHCRIEFFTSTALLLPWVFTTRPFRPSNGAPPYSSVLKLFKVFFNAGFTKSAPILLLRLIIMPALIFCINAVLTPSSILRTTFPAKASHTITSAAPIGTSRASIFPTKLSSDDFLRSGNVSFVISLPLQSSVPIERRPTAGVAHLRTAFE